MTSRTAAKELLHIQEWLDRVNEIDRKLTCMTLSRDLPSWKAALNGTFEEAARTINSGSV